MRTELIREGVTYYRHVVRFTLVNGKRRTWVRYFNVIDNQRQCVGRELDAVFGIEAIKPGSVSIHASQE